MRQAASLLGLRHFVPLVALSVTATFGFGGIPFGLTISTEIAPAGGWAQIKIYAAKPMAIASGHLVLNLDATAFGSGATVGLFGANGDAQGLATTKGAQLDVQFSSATSGIGQLAGLPVMVISVPVLATASGTVAVSATSPDSSVTVGSGSVTVHGTLSVEKIYAGMGVVPAGTVVPVYGSGFTSSTGLTIDGVEIASSQFVSGNEIDVTLGGAAELVGKRARVTDGEVEFDYFCFQPNDPVNFPPTAYPLSVVASVQPLFPLLASTGFAGLSGYVGGAIEVQNPNATTATATVTNLNQYENGVGQTTLSIRPGSWALAYLQDEDTFVLSSNLPVRVVTMAFCGPGVELPVCLTTSGPYDAATEGPAAPALTPSSLAFAWQSGSSTLPPAHVARFSDADPSRPEAMPMRVTTATVSGGPWLSAVLGTASSLGTLSVTVNPSQLALGAYQGSVTAAPSYGPSVTLPVTLTVTDSYVPMLSATPGSISFTVPSSIATPYSQTIAVTSDSGPTPFWVTLQEPYGPLLKVSPMSGMTPANLNVTWDPALASQINYQQPSTPASISIGGLANTIAIPATFNITGVQTSATYLGESGMGPNGLLFSIGPSSSLQTQTIYVVPTGTMTATVNQPWMTATPVTTGVSANQTVTVTVNPQGLAAGTYSGTVTIGEPGIASIAVPVTVAVWVTPPPLTLSENSFTLVQVVGEPAPPYQHAEADSRGVPIPFTISSSPSWVAVPTSGMTPASIRLGLDGPPRTPGEYEGSFTVQSPGSSINVPVTLLIEPGPVMRPVVSQVVNSASGISGGVSPGEILTVRGYSVGASATSGLIVVASDLVASSLNGLQVTFDGKAAPLIYTSANQTNLIVPYEVAGKTSTVMEVTYGAAAGTFQTNAWALPVVAAAPGVFTIDSTGTGQGAIVNQDGTVNSATNPAALGSVISIYATGEGQTSPVGVTGSVTGSGPKTPLLQVTVAIGGIGTTVQYAGSAPGSVAGLLQVNAVVPQGAPTGTAVPITLNIGGIKSQAGVTIAVK